MPADGIGDATSAGLVALLAEYRTVVQFFKVIALKACYIYFERFKEI